MDTADIMQRLQRGSGQQPQAETGVFMGLSMWGILASLLSAGIGFAYFKYGRTTNNTPMVVCGVLLMAYPYFVTNTLAIVLIGAALTLLPKLINRD
jgi:hypothetical protein